MQRRPTMLEEDAPARVYHARHNYSFDPFKRPPLDAPIPHGGSVTFMLLPVTTKRSTSDDEYPLVILHGITEHRQSVWVNVFGSYPYFYIHFPTRRDYTNIVNIIESHLHRHYESKTYLKKFVRKRYIIDSRVVAAEDIRDYKGPGDTKKPHLQLFMPDKSYIQDLRKMIEDWRIHYYNEDTGNWENLERGDIFEAHVRYDVQTMVSKDVRGCYWITAHNVVNVLPKQTRAQIEVRCHVDNLVPHPARADIAPIRVLSYDIECATHDRSHRFVRASEGDPAFAIGIYIYEHGRPDAEAQEVCMSLKPFPGAETESLGEGVYHFDFDDERDLLCAFKDFINACDPDIITGYNIGPFDNMYLADRSKELSIDFSFTDSSRAVKWCCYPKPKVFKSRAQGTKEGAVVKWPGRFQFDLLEYFQKNVKLPFYGLNFVSEKYLGERKAEVTHDKIGPMWRGTAKERRKVYKYCLRDAWLPAAIIKENLYIVSMCEMCRAVGVPFDWLLERGQEAKTEMLFLSNTKAPVNYVFPSNIPPKRNYTGAIVVTPHKGFYEVPVFVNDFSSLYPTIMQAYNLCYTTFGYVVDLLRHGLQEGRDFLVPPLWPKDKDGKELNHNPKFGFVKPHIRKGLAPVILAGLLARRKEARAEQDKYEAAGNKSMAKIYELRQLAFKLTGNSLYGYTSANKFPKTEIAETVCAYGREMIQMTSTLIEGRFNRRTPDVARCLKEGIDPNMDSEHIIYYEHDAKVIYGDSVTPDTWLNLRDGNGNDMSCTIQDLQVDWVEWFGKEYGYLQEDVYVYSDIGWTPIVHVVRHKTRKCIVRVTTHAGSSVCVTADHSLLTHDKQLIRPTDIQVGLTRLLSFCPSVDDGLVASVERLGYSDDFVYDLETESHHFAAGVGTLVVHNTDSVFVSFGNCTVERSREIGQQASAYCKPYYMPPNDSIFEKVLFPLLMLDKKRYSGIFHTWVKDTLQTKLDAKGIETVRRDWTRLCTKTLTSVLEALMYRRDRQECIRIVHGVIEQLYANKTPMSDLILTKGYSKSRAEYDETFQKTGSYPVHIAVAMKMEKRDPATAPKNGDRVPYVLVTSAKREYKKGKGLDLYTWINHF